MTISITNVAKNSLKISAVQTIGAVVALLATMYVATIVLPDEYGIYGFLLLWLTYAGLITPGIINAGNREMPGLLGKGETTAATRIQNVSLTPELIWSLIPFAVILVSAFFFTDYTYRTGLIIVAFSYLSLRLTTFWATYNVTREKFNTVAIAYLIQGVAVPALTLLLVTWLKVYALLLSPLAISIVVWLYYLKKGPINYRFQFDWQEITRLLKIGIILQAGGLVFYAYRLMDRTIIAAMLSQEQLGLYTFASGFIMVALAIPTSFTSVLQPILWRHAEKAKNAVEGFKDAKRIAVYLAFGTAMLIPLMQVAYYLVVELITKKYVGSIPAFNVLSYNICLMAIVLIPNLVLNSAIVNKQKIILILYIIGLAINIALNILVIKLGYGIVGVAWVMIGSQFLVSLATLYLARRYMFGDRMEYFRLQVKILLPFIVSLGFFFLHRYLESAFGLRGFTGISLAAQVVVWGLLIGGFYREYLSFKDIKALFKEISGVKREKPRERP
jgi:O-antigen/teichoic acid export membrane protein